MRRDGLGAMLGVIDSTRGIVQPMADSISHRKYAPSQGSPSTPVVLGYVCEVWTGICWRRRFRHFDFSATVLPV